MNIKDFLQQHLELKNEIANKQTQINELEQLNINNPQITELQRTLYKDLIKLIESRNEVLTRIYKIQDSKLRLLLVKRYICGDTWGKISADMNYSYVHVAHRLHKKALEELEKIKL